MVDDSGCGQRTSRQRDHERSDNLAADIAVDEGLDVIEQRRSVALVHRLADHPRFVAMSLAAHGVAAVGNLGTFALAGGSPLALNYTQWLIFLKALYRWADDQTMRCCSYRDWRHRDPGRQ